jgi:predicted dehydrogenase/threonine dehydrogenase-like Zn-dependent dehydrogenase
MKSVVQPVGGGPVAVLDVPRPVPAPAEVLVRTIASVISPGTERAVTALAQSSLLAKARARPDLVRQVVRKARADGVAATTRAVRGRLAEDLPLGYSAAGMVVEVGSVVSGIRVGQLVATGGAGKANHAEFQAVPWLLCAAVPDGVPTGDAAFATVAAIALHGLRLAEAGPGAKVAIIGLGLVGQLAARLAMAAGCDVAGIDPAAPARAAAARAGVLALDEFGDPTTDRVLAWSRGRGADAVLVCAASPSSGPVGRAPALCRDRAAVVIVGDVGLQLDRAPFYERELSLRFARSYGPGRYDPSYEAWGVDYPAGQVRWTEGRNFEAVLDLLAAGRLRVADLVTHSFDIDDAAAAYQLIEKQTEPYLAIQLSYPAAAAADGPVVIQPAAACSAASAASSSAASAASSSSAPPAVGWIGAGSFSTGTLLPAFRRAGFNRFVAVASASGITARRAAERHGFEKAVSGAFPVIDDPDVGVVVIATPHYTHAELAMLALKDGRHVWCEKPLALTMADLGEVKAAWEASGRQLMVGFNRRWSPAVLAAQRALAEVASPRFLVYRVAAGPVPTGHWYADRRQGGRLLGEVCHFVDTAQALVGAEIEETVSVLGGDGRAADGHGADGGGVPGNDAVVSLRFADGSLATICYGSAMPTAGKEWIEITAGARRLVIDDFRAAKLDGRTLWRGRQDKGHRACAGAFCRAVTGGPAIATETLLATMAATLRAAAGPGCHG